MPLRVTLPATTCCTGTEMSKVTFDCGALTAKDGETMVSQLGRLSVLLVLRLAVTLYEPG